MDVFDDALAPPAYQAVKPIANLLFTLTGVCWVSHYIIMIHKSFQDQSYAMGIMPLCCDFGWELVYVLVYPPPNTVELGVNITSLAVDFAVIYAAVRFSANEWTHTPLVRDNLHWIFLVGIVGFTTGPSGTRSTDRPTSSLHLGSSFLPGSDKSRGYLPASLPR